MTNQPSVIALLLLALATVVPSASAASSKIPDAATTNSVESKPVETQASNWQEDNKQFRSLTLENGLEVVLVSDPKATSASAAMTVRVGSFEDPLGKEGMAHYLEHLLFMGTEKYPKVDEFSEFLAQHQGFANANTWFDRTLYYFEVENESFEPALDRWSGFFTSPLFNANFVEQEKKAVNNEYSNRRDQDGILDFRLFQISQDEDHPASQFLVGSEQTLKNVSRQDVINFYKKYYSANQMYLTLVSQAPLTQMESWVRNKFSTVPNTNRQDLVYSEDSFGDNAGQVYFHNPRGETRRLDLQFQLPNQAQDTSGKTAQLLAMLLGRKDKGSLFDVLAEKGLVTNVASESWDTGFNTMMSVSLTLTESGLSQWQHLVSSTFSYIDFLKKEGLKQHFYEDVAQSLKVSYENRGHIGAAQTAQLYALNMHLYEPQKLDRSLNLLSQYKPKKFQELLKYLSPDNMIVYVNDPEAKTDKVEPHYGVEYSTIQISKEQLSSWKKTKSSGQFSYIESNPWLPNSLNLHDDETKGVEKVSASTATETYLLSDNEFNFPKAYAEIRLYTKAVSENARSRALAELYQAVFEQGARRWGYYPSLAGYGSIDGTLLSPNLNGVTLSLSGYSEKFSPFISTVVEQLKTIDVSEAMFQALKHQLVQSYEEKLRKDPYVIASEGAASVSNPYFYTSQEILIALRNISFEELKNYVANELYQQIGVRALTYGNLSQGEVKVLAQNILSTLDAKPLPQSQWPQRTTETIEPGKPVQYTEKIQSGTNGYYLNVYFGSRDQESLKTEASLQVLEALWSPRFYSELRSVKQLGYIVHSDTAPAMEGQLLRARFIIQSEGHKAEALAQEVESWLTQSLTRLDEVPQESFEAIKKSLITKLQQPATNMEEKLSEISEELFSLDGQFGHKKKLIQAIENLNKEDFVSTIRSGFDKATIQKAVGLVNGRQ